MKISIKQSPSHSFPPAMQQPTWGQPLLTGVFQIKKIYIFTKLWFDTELFHSPVTLSHVIMDIHSKF